MWDQETTWGREAEAIERGFTPRKHNDERNTPAQSAGSLVIGAINFGPALPRSLGEDAELMQRKRASEASVEEAQRWFSEATRPGTKGASAASESAYSSLRSSLGLVPATPDFRIELLEGGRLPTKANPSDAGWDCYAAEDSVIEAAKFTKVRLGFKLQIPTGWEVQLRGRSGLAANKGIISHFGTIDHLYRLELQAMLTLIGWENAMTSHYDYEIKKGDKVCQMVFAPVHNNRLVLVDSVESTERGGFGSTGR